VPPQSSILSPQSSESRFHVFDHGALRAETDRGGVEPHAIHGEVALIAPLPQAVTGQPHAVALSAVEATEAGGPSALAALTHFDDHDQVTPSRHDVELEVLQPQVGGDDLETALG
jgi:hypothetical protein